MFEELTYRDYWRMLVERRWLVAGLTILGCLIGLTIAGFRDPRPIYGARAIARYNLGKGYTLVPGPGVQGATLDLTPQLIAARSIGVLGGAAKRLKIIPEETSREDYLKYPQLGAVFAQLTVTGDPGHSGLLYF